MPGPHTSHSLGPLPAQAQPEAYAQGSQQRLLSPGPRLTSSTGAGLLVESGLLAAIYARARLRRCRGVSLSLAADGAAEVLITGTSLTPPELERLAAGMDDVAGAGAAWERLITGAPAVELDLFPDPGVDGREAQWHLAIVEGVWMGRLARVLRPEPHEGGGGALRLRVRSEPEASAQDLRTDAERGLLTEQLEDLAMLSPGLQTVLTSPDDGLVRSSWLPRGPGQRLAALTEGRLTVLDAPLELEARWDGLRIRCAVQWCVEAPTQLWGFEDGRRTDLRGAPVSALLSALRAGLALHARAGLEVVPLGRLMRGLNAIVAIDRVRAPQRCEISRGSIAASGSLSDAGFLEEAVRELTPLLVTALAVNPRADRLLRWVVEAPDGEATVDTSTDA